MTGAALISLDLWNLVLDISGLFEPDGAARFALSDQEKSFVTEIRSTVRLV
jgi:hypothetical protein